MSDSRCFLILKNNQVGGGAGIDPKKKLLWLKKT